MSTRISPSRLGSPACWSRAASSTCSRSSRPPKISDSKIPSVRGAFEASAGAAAAAGAISGAAGAGGWAATGGGVTGAVASGARAAGAGSCVGNAGAGAGSAGAAPVSTRRSASMISA